MNALIKRGKSKNWLNQACGCAFSAFASLKSLALLGLVFSACNSQANEALARKQDCLGCHAVATKLVGPAFKDVASKYAEQSNALEQVSQSIRNGGVGKWGELPMPAQTKLSATDVKKLAVWILSIK